MVWCMDSIDDYIKSVGIAYAKSGGENWPASGRKIMGSYIRLAALNQLDLLNKVKKIFSEKEIASLFWSTTQIRYILTGEFVVGLKLCERDAKNPTLTQITEGAQFFLNLLKQKSVEDPFCLHGHNNTLKETEIARVLKMKFLNKDEFGLIKRVSAALESLSWAFGYDTHFSNFMDIHGPYKVSKENQMLVREFKFDSIADVWGKELSIPKRIRFYLIYSNKDIKIDWELHTETKEGLVLEKALAVLVEGEKEISLEERELEQILQTSSVETIKQVNYVNSLSVIDKIRKGALLSFLQTKCLADALGEDWRPGKEVEEAILLKGEEIWLGKKTLPATQKPHTDDWRTNFDPRLPRK